MSAHAIYPMDAAIEEPRQATEDAPGVRPEAWCGAESPWVLAASAAAPWPLLSFALWLGVPGGARVPAFSHGVLALALVLAAMVIWTHRPTFRSGLRFAGAVLGTGLLGELLANALTDMGRAGGVGELSAPARALSAWARAFGVYEVAPIVAATSRIVRGERRSLGLDLAAHGLILALAAGVYAWPPTWGTAWYVSPWMVVAVALPFAAARSGPRRAARLPAPNPRGWVLFGLAAVAWSLLGIFAATQARTIERALHGMRWGVDPLEGLLGLLPALSLGLSLLAAALLLARTRRLRRMASGVITEVGDGGVTIEQGGDEPTTVTIDAGPLPAPGTTVTLIGVTRRSLDAGPFRDGAPSLRARRAWVGAPEQLATAMSQRAAGWLAWAALSAGGVLIRLL